MGDGSPATDAWLNRPTGVAIDSSGNIYISEPTENRIRKVDTNSIITTVAGNGEVGYTGDGGPAIDARLNYPYGLAVDSKGNIYIADSYNHCIRMVDTSGIITTVAGNGTPDYTGDGGSAVDATLDRPQYVAVDSMGNIYISDFWNSCVRKVDTNNIITTVAGNSNTWNWGVDDIPATEARLNYLQGIAVDSSGNLYISESMRIRKVDLTGIISTVAGTGEAGYSGDGGLATDAKLYDPCGIAVDSTGNIYIGDRYNLRVRKVNTSGIISTVAGNGYYAAGCPTYNGILATEALIGEPRCIATDPLGNVYIPGGGSRPIVNEIYPSPLVTLYGLNSDELLVQEENGEGYVFFPIGRHLKTIDLATGETLRTFAYNEENRLISITDQFGNQTTIQRDGDGVPFSITSPDEIVTSLTIDPNNHLTEIRYPDNSAYSFTYTASGLMTDKIDPNDNPFTYEFNSIGRVIRVTDSESGDWQFDRSVDETGTMYASVLTGEGNLTQYLDTVDSTGAYTSEITDPTGALTFYSESGDGLSVNKSLPCGMELAFTYDVDSEYKFKFVKEMTETTPAGLARVTLREKTYQDTDTDEVPDLITGTVAVNGNTTTLENNTLQSQKTITSPEGRTVATLYDPVTLLTTNLTVPGLYDTFYEYNTEGRLTSIITNTRETSFTYNPQGFLDSITDPENYTTTYTHDPIGRITGIHRPDGSSLGFVYNPGGNMTVLTNPSTINHGFGYNGVNLNSSYQTPISGSYTYLYDKDRRLAQTNFPSGRQINNIYNKTRLVQIQTPEGNIDLGYLCSTKVGSVTKGSDSISYGYDGSLVTSVTLSGTLNTSLGYTYNVTVHSPPSLFYRN